MSYMLPMETHKPLKLSDLEKFEARKNASQITPDSKCAPLLTEMSPSGAPLTPQALRSIDNTLPLFSPPDSGSCDDHVTKPVSANSSNVENDYSFGGDFSLSELMNQSDLALESHDVSDTGSKMSHDSPTKAKVKCCKSQDLNRYKVLAVARRTFVDPTSHW